MRRIVSAEETRAVAAQTISEIAGIVGQTLGPGGNPIALQQPGQNPDGSPKNPRSINGRGSSQRRRMDNCPCYTSQMAQSWHNRMRYCDT